MTTTCDTNWTKCIDKNTGHPYFWNMITKEVTWEMPEDFATYLQQTANEPKQSSWILAYSDDGTQYYFNEAMREISWEKPSDYIELITKHQIENVKSQSSGDEVQKKSNGLLNLVATYDCTDSEDDDDDDNDDAIAKHPKSIVSTTLKSSPSEVVMVQKKNKKSLSDDHSDWKEDKRSSSSDENTSSNQLTFASIITGGRSPDASENQEPTLNEEAIEPNEVKRNDFDDLYSKKQLKRKRRIEFNTAKCEMSKPLVFDENERALKKDKAYVERYANFTRGSVECSNQKSEEEIDEFDNEKDKEIDVDTTEKMLDLKSTLEAKLNFLSQGKDINDIMPVQVMQIQLQTLLDAYTKEALLASYLLKWLNNLSMDLGKLESDAAPADWKCIWNREKAVYCYENLSNGIIQFDYPTTRTTENVATAIAVASAVTDGDSDEMDISTTPPHEIDTNESFVPDAPNWSTTHNDNKTIAPLADELATFYSDIATLEQAPFATTTSTSSSVILQTVSESNSNESIDAHGESDEKQIKLKKKKKQKKLEPWRSGNLETWINKWQKAQKELDGHE